MKIPSVASAMLVCTLGLASFSATAEDLKTVAAIYENRAALAGQTVSAQGKVVKVVSGIMKRNFVHVQDGTGGPDSNDLIVTTKQTAKVGEQVTISGKVVVDRDFGSGYFFPLLIEDGSIAVKK